MNVTTIAIAVALIVFVLAKRVRGEAVREPKKLFLLPVIVGIIGLQNVSHAKPNAVDIGVIAIGAALSLGLGLLRGKVDRVTLVNGSPFMSWTGTSIAVLAVNVLAKLALDAGGVAAGGTSSALSSSILLSLGLTLLGEAAVVWFRSQSLTSGGSGPSGGSWTSGGSGFSGGASTSGGSGTTAGPGISGRSGSGRYRGSVRKSGRPTIWPPTR
jgi:hypothetical protein